MVATEIFLIAAGVICVVEMIKRMWRAVLKRN